MTDSLAPTVSLLSLGLAFEILQHGCRFTCHFNRKRGISLWAVLGVHQEDDSDGLCNKTVVVNARSLAFLIVVPIFWVMLKSECSSKQIHALFGHFESEDFAPGAAGYLIAQIGTARWSLHHPRRIHQAVLNYMSGVM